jgi:hypothetical protein
MVLLNEIDVLRDVSRRPDHAGIRYMLTGSLAMNYWAEPRMTRDIDLVIELQQADVGKVVALFSDAYLVSSAAVAEAIHRERMFNIIHDAAVIKVDFIIRKSPEYRVVEFARRQRVPVADFEISLVSREDLILSKLLWAKDSRSGFQLRDVGNLLAGECDTDYLLPWADRLGVGDLPEEKPCADGGCERIESLVESISGLRQGGR